MEINKIHIYRLFHIENLEYILKKALFCPATSKNTDPNYKTIGEEELIGLRTEHTITTVNSNETINPAKGYLPFYFSARSVMLYRIETGFNIKKVPQEDIIHLVCKLEDIITKADYLFTDGHGYAKFTRWFDDIKHINEIDWNIVKSETWYNSEENPDRQRKKQAEFWTKHEIQLDKIIGLGVYNEAAKDKVEELCEKHNRKIAVKVKKAYYY